VWQSLAMIGQATSEIRQKKERRSKLQQQNRMAGGQLAGSHKKPVKLHKQLQHKLCNRVSMNATLF